MIYIYPEQNLRAYPGTIRGTEEWDSTYKIRVNGKNLIIYTRLLKIRLCQIFALLESG